MVGRIAGFMLTALLGLFTSVAIAIPPPLPDQHGNMGGMDKFTGKPVIVFVTSLHELPDLGKWEEAIRPKLPDMNSLDIGDIDTTSTTIDDLVVKELDKHVPKGISVYIDEKNLWAKEYGLDVSEPCVLIFDAQHNLVEKFSGKPNGKLLDQVVAAAKQYFPPLESASQVTP